MLLARGPTAFLNDALAAVGLRAHGGAASDQIEARVVALQVLSGQLAEAVARVVRGAGARGLGALIEDGWVGGDAE